MSKPLKIAGASIRPSSAARASQAITAPGEARRLTVDVENPNTTPLHVWATRSAYEYDPATRVLTVYLTEHVPELPPGIKMLSDHPRTPAQMEIKAKGKGTVEVTVPAFIRRRVPGKGGLGMSFVEEPIGQVDRVDLHVQYADQPWTEVAHEDPAEHRARLRGQGDVVRTSITLVEKKEY